MMTLTEQINKSKEDLDLAKLLKQAAKHGQAIAAFRKFNRDYSHGMRMKLWHAAKIHNLPEKPLRICAHLIFPSNKDGSTRWAAETTLIGFSTIADFGFIPLQQIADTNLQPEISPNLIG